MINRLLLFLAAAGVFASLATSALAANTNPAPIVINEIWNGSTATDEYVEFYNTTDSPVDVSEWTFVRRSNFTGSDALMYLFPGKSKSNTTVIPAHGYYVIGDAPIGVTTNNLPGSYANAISSTTNQSLALKDWSNTTIDGFGNASGIPGPGASNYVEGEIYHFLIGGNAGVARIPNGVDTGNNSADFAPITATSKTPGATNGTQRPVARPIPNPVAPNPGTASAPTAPQSTGGNAQTLEWITDLAEGQRKGVAENKKILVYFWSAESEASTYFENEVFPKEAVKTALSQYVTVKLDFSQNTEIAYKLQVFKSGVFMTYDSKGQYLGRIEGRPRADEFVAKLNGF